MPTKMNGFPYLKERLRPTYEKLLKEPKKVFFAGIGLLLLSLALSIVQYVYFPNFGRLSSLDLPREPKGARSLESQASQSRALESAQKEQQMEKIVSALSHFQQKAQSNALSAADSLEVRRLYHQYENLKP